MTTILHNYSPDILTQVIAETRRGRIMAMLVALSALNTQGRPVADTLNVSPDTARADVEGEEEAA